MRRIFWDTMLFVYWLEGSPKQAAQITRVRESMTQAGDILCANLFIFSELMVGPTRIGDNRTIEGLEEYFLRSNEVRLLPYTEEAVKTFAGLRAKGIKALDAIHLATAAHAGVDLFLTNDHRLQSLTVPGIKFIASIDANLF